MWTKVTVPILDMGDGKVFAVSILEGLMVKQSEEAPHVEYRDAGRPEADGAESDGTTYTDGVSHEMCDRHVYVCK